MAKLLLGKTVRLFLVEGAASGLTTAEIMNWTGHVLTGARSGLPAFLKRSELDRTGIYFLTGPDPQNPETLQVYIGESDSVRKRLAQHNKDKDFWERTCVITSKDENITKAHARYLEARLIAIAKASGNAGVVNGTEPQPPRLPEADASDMEVFIEQIKLIFPVLGFDYLREYQPVAPPNSPMFQLTHKKSGIEAQAREVGEEFVVLEGSDAATDWTGAPDLGYATRHRQLVESGKLVEGEGGLRRFDKDVPFPSPSAASSVVLGRSSNGRKAWKVAESGMSYGDWHSKEAGKAVEAVA